MNCVIPGANIKILSRTFQALARIGDELCLECKPDNLIFRSINATTTAYCTFTFSKAFFSSYEIEENIETTNLDCVIPMKAILGVFKSYGHKDKKPEMCGIELQQDSTKIIFKFKYKHNVVVVRSLYLNDGKNINVTYNKLMSNQVSATAQLFTQVLVNFQMADDDMSIDISSNKALMRNYITGDTDKTRGIRSQITLNAGEFNSFKIGEETSVTFSLKPFRAAISFAETFNLGICINFEKPGKPAVLCIKHPTFEVEFVTATLNNSNDHASQSTLSSVKKNQVQNKNVSMQEKNLSIQDKQALESVNWENDFIEPPPNNKSAFTELMNKVNKNGTTDKRQHSSTTQVNKVVEDEPLENTQKSLEVSRNKKIKYLFEVCYKDTFSSTLMNYGEVLVPDSDPE